MARRGSGKTEAPRLYLYTRNAIAHFIIVKIMNKAHRNAITAQITLPFTLPTLQYTSKSIVYYVHFGSSCRGAPTCLTTIVERLEAYHTTEVYNVAVVAP